MYIVVKLDMILINKIKLNLNINFKEVLHRNHSLIKLLYKLELIKKCYKLQNKKHNKFKYPVNLKEINLRNIIKNGITLLSF